MVEVVVGEVVDCDALRRKPVPSLEVEGEESADGSSLMVTHVVPTHLAGVVRESIRICVRLREQEQPGILVGVARDQHDPRRLEVLFGADHVVHTSRAPLPVDLDRRDVGLCDDLEIARLERLGDRRNERRILRVDRAHALVAEAMVGACRPSVVPLRVDRGGPGEGVPT